MERCPVCDQLTIPEDGVQERSLGPIASETANPEEYYGDFPDYVIARCKSHLAYVIEHLGCNGALEMLANLLRARPQKDEDWVCGLQSSDREWSNVLKNVAEAMYTEGYE